MAKKIEYIISAKDKTGRALKSVEGGLRGVNNSSKNLKASMKKMTAGIGVFITAFITAKNAAASFAREIDSLAKKKGIFSNKDIDAVREVATTYEELDNILKMKFAVGWGKMLRLAESGYTAQIKFAGAVRAARDALIRMESPMNAYRGHLEALKKGEEELTDATNRRLRAQVAAAATSAAQIVNQKAADAKFILDASSLEKEVDDYLSEQERAEDLVSQADQSIINAMEDGAAKKVEQIKKDYGDRIKALQGANQTQEEAALEIALIMEARKKINDVRKAALTEGAEEEKSYRQSINERLAQIRVDMIRDDNKREIEQIKKDAKEKLATIKGTSDAETELRKRIIAQARRDIAGVGAEGEPVAGKESNIGRSSSGFRSAKRGPSNFSSRSPSAFSNRNKSGFGGAKKIGKNGDAEGAKKRGKSDVDLLDLIVTNTAYLKDNLTAS